MNYGVLVFSSWVQIEVVVEWRLGCHGAWLGDGGGGGDVGCARGGSARLRSGADDGFLRSGGREQEHAHGRLLHVHVSAQGRDGGGAGEGGFAAHHVRDCAREPVRHRPAPAPFQCHILASARIQSTLCNKILTELIHDCTSSESESI